MKEFSKPVFKCEYCDKEYYLKEQCLACEKKCLKKKEQQSRRVEVEQAKKVWLKLLRKYNEDYGIDKEIEQQYKDYYGTDKIDNCKVKCYHNGKECDIREAVNFISLDPFNELKFFI